MKWIAGVKRLVVEGAAAGDELSHLHLEEDRMGDADTLWTNRSEYLGWLLYMDLRWGLECNSSSDWDL